MTRLTHGFDGFSPKSLATVSKLPQLPGAEDGDHGGGGASQSLMSEIESLNRALDTLEQNIETRLESERLKQLNHTIALHHAEREVQNRLEINAKLKEQIDEIIAKLSMNNESPSQ